MAFESGLNQVVNFIVEIGDQESAAFAASFEVILNALLRPIPLSADCVAKLFAALRTRNNRIQRVSILNQ